jgi:Flp pilus assembly protein TadG
MFRTFLRARRGSIAVYTGVMLPVLAGMAGLGSEYAYGMMSKSQNQRIADAAAFAGAQAYATLVNSNATGATAAMNAAVSRMATLNGLDSTAAVGSLVASPTGDGKQAVQVTVTTTQNLVLTQMISDKTSLTIKASAFAELTPGSGGSGNGTPGCVLAVSATGGGVTMSGGTTLSAPSCAVNSNNTVTVPCGTYITTTLVTYNSAAAPSVGCPGGIAAPTGKTLTISKASTTDWLAGNATVSQAATNYATVAAMTAPTGPSVASKTAIVFGWTTSGSSAPSTLIASQSSNGCSASWASGTSTWTVTCANNGTYSFGDISLGGGINVNWALGGTGSTYSFSGAIRNTGATLKFGAGNYKAVTGLYTGGGSATQFLYGGTFQFGRNTNGCSSAYSICHTGSSLSFAGPVNMTLSNGLDSGNTTMTIGAGSTANSYNLGPGNGTNKVFNVGGGGKLTLADATSGGSFNAVGNITTGGGSCLTLPAAAQHNIKGNISSAGGLTLGAGVYTINGYFALGENGGGAVSCAGGNIGLSANGVVLQVGGAATATGSCNGYVFCATAGFTNVTLVAPAEGATAAGFAVIGPTSSARTGGALFAGGASGVSVSGVFYVPYGSLQMSGGAGLGDGSGACLELIAKDVTLSGGTALASTCTGLGGTGSDGGGSGEPVTSTVMLVK